MRSFIVLCLLATAFGDKLGYNYHPVPHSEEGLSFTPGVGSIAAHHAISPLSPEQIAPVASIRNTASTQQLTVPVASSPIAPASVTSAPVTHAPIALAQNAPALAHASAPAPVPVVTEYQKEFYTYTAPQADFDDVADHGDVANSLKKSLRVVFIKAPENKGLQNAALKLAKQATEEKTTIYVLAKQADIGSLGQQLQNIRTQSSTKPEVHFVKYRTPQDAANAQQAIQQQYESLPGSSRKSNEGSAPVLNFASQPVAAAAPAPAGPGPEYLPTNAVPSQEYLPPNLRRLSQ